MIAVVSIWLGDRILSDSVEKSHNSTLSPFVTTVALVYGALLGFTVVVAWEQFSTASANVASEASTLTPCTAGRSRCRPPSSNKFGISCGSTRLPSKGPEWE